NRSHNNLRKYSCLGNDKKLRESVSIPTKRLNRPILDSALICLVIPSFWSRNHHADPNWILPGTEPSLKLPIMVAINSLSAGLRLYKMVLANWSSRSSRSKKVESARPWLKSPMESQPVSGPKCRIIRELLFRNAPRWYCCTHPLPASHCANKYNMADLNWRCSTVDM